MVQHHRHIFFKDEQDFLEHVKQDITNKFYYSGGYIETKPERFPATFRYFEGWDTGMCGTWVEEDSEKMASCIRNSLAYLNKMLDYIEGR